MKSNYLISFLISASVHNAIGSFTEFVDSFIPKVGIIIDITVGGLGDVG